MHDCIVVTGGAGFIGSNFVLRAAASSTTGIVNLDKLTYAGNLHNLESLQNSSRHWFVLGDICDRELVKSLFSRHRPRAVVHFAAESHVDRSILGPEEFIRTNVGGTFALLEEARGYWQDLPDGDKEAFRFLHVSTDEVYGSLGPSDPASLTLIVIGIFIAFIVKIGVRKNGPLSYATYMSGLLFLYYGTQVSLRGALITNYGVIWAAFVLMATKSAHSLLRSTSANITPSLISHKPLAD